MMPCIYVAGPMTNGDVGANVRNAINAGEYLRQRGFAVYVPHLCWFWSQVHTVSYEEWMQHDLAWLARCDAMLRLEGESPGASREQAYAVQHGIPVFHSLGEALRWRSARVVLDG
jgi:nucleoside 2-deoxyribosyltransferase